MKSIENRGCINQMIQVPLGKFFTKYQTIFMQGIQSDIPRSMLHQLTNKNVSKIRRDLKELFRIGENDALHMPVVMIMWSPFHKIQAFSGEEALPFLRPFYARSGTPLPPPEYYNRTTQGLVNIANHKPPKVREFRIKYDYYNNGITVVFKQVFGLEPTDTIFNFSPLKAALKEAEQVAQRSR